MLGDSNDPITRLDHQALAPIAASLGLTLVAAEAANPAEFEPAVARLIANRSEAIFPGSVLAYNFRGRLIELANESHVPVIGLRAVWADSAALFSYGTSLDDQHRLDTAPRRPRPVQGSETAKARLLFLIWVGSVVKQLQRRQVLIATGGLLMRPVCSAQTTGRAPVVGLLSPFPMPSQEAWANTPFSKRLRELGWIEGKNIVVEQARSDGKNDRLAGLAEGLVRKKVDVIFAVAPDAAVIAARATNTIPIVFVAVALPTELGLVASLASPGGNVTGVAFNAGAEMQLAKPLELLKQIAPSATRLAVIYSAVTSETVSGTAFTYPAMTDAIRGLGFNASVHTSERDEDLGAMFASMIDARAQAILALAIPFTTRIQRRIAEFAVQNRLPTASDLSQFVESGMLVSQGPDLAETTRGAVDILDRVLRGARPATLPVELPRRFEVAVNLKTAKAIGLTIPHSILLSADKVIS